MRKADHLYEPHLVLREFSLSPGKEWLPKLSGWTLMQVGSGNGYWLEGQSRTELEAGAFTAMQCQLSIAVSNLETLSDRSTYRGLPQGRL